MVEEVAKQPSRNPVSQEADPTPAGKSQAYDGSATRVPEEGRSPVSKGPAEGAEAELAEELAKEVARFPDESPRVPEEGRSPVSKGPFSDLEGVAGIGIDVVGIAAFAEQLEQPGTRFAEAFTPGERRAARSGAGSEAESLAARWAAKEAVIKAWSSTRYGQEEVIDPEHVDLREIEVRTDAWGRPEIRLHGAIADSMASYAVLVSLTHDESADVAAAFVVLQEKRAS
jgi:holo-[acyl-carrier protein] synthase